MGVRALDNPHGIARSQQQKGGYGGQSALFHACAQPTPGANALLRDLGTRYTLSMISTDHHSPGASCWVELTAGDRNAANSFYESPPGRQAVAHRPATASTAMCIGDRRAARRRACA